MVQETGIIYSYLWPDDVDRICYKFLKGINNSFASHI
jgi:hypothetical protein